jgi:hypothetical protein
MSAERNGTNQFELVVDGKSFALPVSKISGADIKSLAGVDGSYGLWQERGGTEDIPIANEHEIDLTKTSTTRFFTGMTASVAG